jgi:hypothetical protein
MAISATANTPPAIPEITSGSRPSASHRNSAHNPAAIHWADEPSLRFLVHLAHRLAGLRVVIALTVRSGSEKRRQALSSLLLEGCPPSCGHGRSARRRSRGW